MYNLWVKLRVRVWLWRNNEKTMLIHKIRAIRAIWGTRLLTAKNVADHLYKGEELPARWQVRVGAINDLGEATTWSYILGPYTKYSAENVALAKTNGLRSHSHQHIIDSWKVYEPTVRELLVGG